MSRTSIRRGAMLAASALSAVAIVACSSAPRQEAQWSDPGAGAQFRVQRGEKILVACDAYDAAVRQICQDKLVRDVGDSGAIPVSIPPGTALLNDRDLDGQLIASATAAGAKAILVMTLAPATTDAGSGVSLGLGGFSFGRGGGGGVGLSVPIGGGRANTGFTANGRVTDVGTSRLVWTASFTASPSADLDAQFATLSRSMVDSARRAGVF